jgi:hypothetical protein
VSEPSCTGFSPGLSTKAFEGWLTVAWFISYQHLLRLDEAGVKFVPHKAAAVAEGQHLETLGYIVTGFAKSSHPVWPGQSNDKTPASLRGSHP